MSATLAYRRVEVSHPDLSQAAVELLGDQPTDEDCLVIGELVGYLKRGSFVTVESLGARLGYHFSARAGRSKAGAFNRFKAAHDAIGYQVVTDQNTVFITPKESIMSAANQTTAPIAPTAAAPSDAQMSAAFAAFADATARADKTATEAAQLASQFKAGMEALNQATASAQQTIDAVRKEAAAAADALRKQAEEALKAEQAKTEAAAKKATDAADHCEAMAKAMAAQREAASHEVAGDGVWYESTPVKVVGGLALAGGLAAAGYYGWKAWAGQTA